MTNYTHLRKLLDELASEIGYTPPSFSELEEQLPALLDRLEVLEHYNATLLKTCDHMREQRGKEQARLEKLEAVAEAAQLEVDNANSSDSWPRQNLKRALAELTAKLEGGG